MLAFVAGALALIAELAVPDRRTAVVGEPHPRIPCAHLQAFPRERLDAGARLTIGARRDPARTMHDRAPGSLGRAFRKRWSVGCRVVLGGVVPRGRATLTQRLRIAAPCELPAARRERDARRNGAPPGAGPAADDRTRVNTSHNRQRTQPPPGWPRATGCRLAPTPSALAATLRQPPNGISSARTSDNPAALDQDAHRLVPVVLDVRVGGGLGKALVTRLDHAHELFVFVQRGHGIEL
jgi:hypothetical protein